MTDRAAQFTVLINMCQTIPGEGRCIWKTDNLNGSVQKNIFLLNLLHWFRFVRLFSVQPNLHEFQIV